MKNTAPYNFASNTLRKVAKNSDIPTGTSYIIQFTSEGSVEHEGDQRSRDCPGHGYPAYTEHYTKSEQFVTTDKEVWNAAITSLTVSEHVFVAFIANRPEIKRDVKVVIS